MIIPLISHWEDLKFAVTPTEQEDNSDDLVSAAFNSYRLNTPLFEAVKSNDLELVRSLLEGSIEESAKNNSPLTTKQKMKMQKKDKGQQQQRTTYYNVNAEDPKGITPLIEATLLGSTELVQLLLAHGARAQPLPGFRHTALRAACLTANVELIQLLLQKGADPNAKSEGGRTPLMGACYLRPQFDEREDRIDLSNQAVKVMIEDSRTDASIKNDFGESAMDLCRQRGYRKSLVLLRQRVGGIKQRRRIK